MLTGWRLLQCKNSYCQINAWCLDRYQIFRWAGASWEGCSSASNVWMEAGGLKSFGTWVVSGNSMTGRQLLSFYTKETGWLLRITDLVSGWVEIKVFHWEYWGRGWDQWGRREHFIRVEVMCRVVSGDPLPRFESWSHHSPIMRLWASLIIFPCSSFLVCKWG